MKLIFKLFNKEILEQLIQLNNKMKIIDDKLKVLNIKINHISYCTSENITNNVRKIGEEYEN